MNRRLAAEINQGPAARGRERVQLGGSSALVARNARSRRRDVVESDVAQRDTQNS